MDILVVDVVALDNESEQNYQVTGQIGNEASDNNGVRSQSERTRWDRGIFGPEPRISAWSTQTKTDTGTFTHVLPINQLNPNSSFGSVADIVVMIFPS